MRFEWTVRRLACVLLILVGLLAASCAPTTKVTQVFVLAGHTDGVTAVDFSWDGTRLVSGSEDYTARVWDVTSGELLQTLEGAEGVLLDVAFSPAGSVVAAPGFDNVLYLWSLDSGEIDLAFVGEYNENVHAVAFNPDRHSMAIVSGDKRVRVWNFADPLNFVHLGNHNREVWSVSYHPDGHLVATASLDGEVRLWEIATHYPIRKFQEAHIRCIAFHPDGRRLASGGEDGMIRLWDGDAETELRVLEGHTAEVTAVAFSPDGRYLVSGSRDATVRVWDVEGGSLLHTLDDHDDVVRDVAFVREGDLFASASLDNRLIVWRLES